MAGILRGEIYWGDLDPVLGNEQAGRRPVLILSHEPFNERSRTVIAMAITSRVQRAGYPLTWELPSNPLPRRSWVKISQIRNLAIERLGPRIGKLDDATMQSILDGLLELIE